MKKITVLGIKFTDEQKKRLNALGTVEHFPSPSTSDEFLKLVKDADIICSDGSFLLENLSKLKNVFVTYPYIELGVFNSEDLKKNGVFVANTQGSNRDAIVEWVMFMVLSLFRKFPTMVRVTNSFQIELKESLVGKKVLIVGMGNIGTKISELCEAFGINIDFFERSDNLLTKSKNVDLVINALNSNSSSKNLLNEKFFMSLKKGAYFVTFVRYYTFDIDGLIKAIKAGIVKSAAIDCDPESPGDTTNKFYKKALANKNILVTPHIAFSAKQASMNGKEFVVQNVEAYVSGHPKNVLVKN